MASIGDVVALSKSDVGLQDLTPCFSPEVAEAIGVTAATVAHWEKNATEPPTALIPAIVRFLGFDPLPEPTTLQERMRGYRKRHGLSTNEAAHRAGVHADTWRHWERTGAIPWELYRALLDAFLASDRSAPLTLAVATDDIVP